MYSNQLSSANFDFTQDYLCYSFKMRKSRAIEFIRLALERAKEERPRGKLTQIADLAKVDPGTLTHLRKNPNYQPGYETLLGIWWAIFKVFPDLKSGNFSLLFEEMSQSMQTGHGGRLSLDEIEEIMAFLDILSRKNEIKPDILKACLSMIHFTRSQLPEIETPLKDLRPIPPKTIKN